jgi:hypothetical protein
METGRREDTGTWRRGEKERREHPRSRVGLRRALAEPVAHRTLDHASGYEEHWRSQWHTGPGGRMSSKLRSDKRPGNGYHQNRPNTPILPRIPAYQTHLIGF